ncbi:hydrolase [Tabrizicola sp.]|uniref:hydrolase n=1 Tax=Tabrizicola sp. TaxID=2005166 RepID=UPI0025EE0F3C|nr:hydrolase [Tabrizicola sp.]
MQTNALPVSDRSDNTTGCCPRFNPAGWEGAELHFRDKLFLRAETVSAMHIPLNMGKVFSRVQRHIDAAAAMDPDQSIVLSRDLSAFKGEHLFAVTRVVPDEQMLRMSGDYVTKVFEGPYREAKDWHETLKALSASHGKEDGRIWFFYTTCPKCAKAYGENYVVGLAEV